MKRSPCLTCENSEKDKNICSLTCIILESYRTNFLNKRYDFIPALDTASSHDVLTDEEMILIMQFKIDYSDYKKQLSEV